MRGKGKKPSLVYVSVRLSREVAEYLNTFPSRSKKIREILEEYVKQQGKQNEEIK